MTGPKRKKKNESHALQVYWAQQINFKISVITSGIYYHYSKCFSPFKILQVSTSMGAQDPSRGGLGFTPSHNGVRNTFSSKFCSAFKVCTICHLYVGKHVPSLHARQALPTSLHMSKYNVHPSNPKLASQKCTQAEQSKLCLLQKGNKITTPTMPQ